MRRLTIFILTIVCLFGAHASLNEANRRLASSTLRLFENLGARRQALDASLDSIKDVRRATDWSPARVAMTEKLGDIYADLHLDSAMVYYTLALNEAQLLNLEDTVKKLELKRLSYYPLHGLSAEALQRLATASSDSMAAELKREYWRTTTRVMAYIAEACDEGPFKNAYKKRTIASLDSLARYEAEGSPLAGFIGALRHEYENEEALAVASYTEVLPYLDDNELKEHAIAYIASYYADRPQYRQEFIANTLKLAANQLERGIVVPGALAEAGKIFYDESDKVVGGKMILKAMEQSNDGKDRYRHFEYADYAGYLSDRASSTHTWIVALSCMLIAALIALSTALIHSRRKRTELAEQCEEAAETAANELAENQRIGDSALALSFLAQEQLTDYNRFVLRKLKAGQAKDLYAELDNGSFVNSQKEKFFSSFDEIVLANFPDFVEKLNALFLPGKELALLPGRRLSPELRIAAYMRFGVTDSAKLAQALGLSVNTIYTYRNRLKGRAVDRLNFEENLRNIK